MISEAPRRATGVQRARRVLAAALDAEVDDGVASFVEEVDDIASCWSCAAGALERRVTVGSGDHPGPGAEGQRQARRGRAAISSGFSWVREAIAELTEALPALNLRGLLRGRQD